MTIDTPPTFGSEPAPGQPSRGGGANREGRKRRPRPLPSPATGRISPSAAVITRPFLVVLPVLALLIPGLLIAFLRAPSYSAEARLLVGSFDVASQAVPGVVEASRSLAETYSRLITSDAIVVRTAEKLGVPPEEVKGAVSASSIPNASLIRVRAVAGDAVEAMRFANAAATALVDYASAGEGDGEEVLDRYEQALLELRQIEAEVETARAAVDAAIAAGDRSLVAARRETLVRLEAAAERARLRSSSLADRYARATGSAGSGTLQLVGEAVDTGSDRRTGLQLAIGTALVLGLISGVALATVAVNRSYASERADRPTRRP